MDPYDFLGNGFKFPLQIDKRTGHLAMVGHEENIMESVGIILNTGLGERVMRDQFGTNIAEYLFGPSTALAVQNVAVRLAEALTRQEPRIRDVSVSVSEGSDPYTGRLVIQVEYTVRTTNNRYNHVYPFYMEEGNREGSII